VLLKQVEAVSGEALRRGAPWSWGGGGGPDLGPEGHGRCDSLFARTDTGRLPTSSSSSWCSGARATAVRARLALKVVVAKRAAAPFAPGRGWREGRGADGRFDRS
jgi:hypothetical protein